VIASLLPGLRDVRTPLATGYLWLIVLWLLLYEHLPKSIDAATGPIKSLYQLGALVGTTACLAAISFVAYLVGSMLSLYPRQYILAIIQPRVIDPNYMRKSNFTRIFKYGLRNILSVHLGNKLYNQLETFVLPKIREEGEALGEDRLGQVLPTADWGMWSYRPDNSLPGRYVYAILQELSAVGIQLQVRNRDLWDTYDRQSSEAQFRFGIAPPLVLVIVVLAWESHRYWWLIVLVLPLALLLQGVRQTVSAAAALVQAVVLGMVEPPVLERVGEQIAMKDEDEQGRANEHHGAAQKEIQQDVPRDESSD
jgi:hypothetical protein